VAIAVASLVAAAAASAGVAQADVCGPGPPGVPFGPGSCAGDNPGTYGDRGGAPSDSNYSTWPPDIGDFGSANDSPNSPAAPIVTPSP
jgi:hypothetical protein